jgi:hypothetical protein
MDLTFANHGSIFTMDPVTDAGREWIAEHIPEDAQTWGNAIVIEHRYVRAIYEGAAADGLDVVIV